MARFVQTKTRAKIFNTNIIKGLHKNASLYNKIIKIEDEKKWAVIVCLLIASVALSSFVVAYLSATDTQFKKLFTKNY